MVSRLGATLLAFLALLPPPGHAGPVDPGPCAQADGGLGVGADALLDHEGRPQNVRHEATDEEALADEIRARSDAEPDLRRLLDFAPFDPPNASWAGARWERLWTLRAALNATDVRAPCYEPPPLVPARSPGRDGLAGLVHVGLPENRTGRGAGVFVLAGSAPGTLAAFDRAWTVRSHLEAVLAVELNEPVLRISLAANLVLRGELDWTTLGERIPLAVLVQEYRIDRGVERPVLVDETSWMREATDSKTSLAQGLHSVRHENRLVYDALADLAGNQLEAAHAAYDQSLARHIDRSLQDEPLAPSAHSLGDVGFDNTTGLLAWSAATAAGPGILDPYTWLRRSADGPARATLDRFLSSPKRPDAIFQAFLDAPPEAERSATLDEAVARLVSQAGGGVAAQARAGAAFAPLLHGPATEFSLPLAGLVDDVRVAAALVEAGKPRAAASLLGRSVAVQAADPGPLSQACAAAMGAGHLELVIPASELPQHEDDVALIQINGTGADYHRDYLEPGRPPDASRKGWVLALDCAGNDGWSGAFGSSHNPLGVGLALDLGGDDGYFSFQQNGQGVGEVGGVGVLADLAGNDLHEAHKMSFGFANTGGVGLLLDGGGDDVYRFLENKTIPDSNHYGQGVGLAGGAGILLELDGRDRYEVRNVGQGSAGADDDADLCATANALGLGALVDLAGDDLYLGSVYVQGSAGCLAGGLGLLYDGAGADHYGADRGAQGHAGIGGAGVLVDAAGSDVYRANSTAMGASLGGVGALIDLAGDDALLVPSSEGHDCAIACAGGAGGRALHYDGGGDDVYTAWNHALGAALGAGSSALFLSEGGRDDHHAGSRAMGTATGGPGNVAVHHVVHYVNGAAWSCASALCGGFWNAGNAAWWWGGGPLYDGIYHPSACAYWNGATHDRCSNTHTG
jgi:hypothetical protein